MQLTRISEPTQALPVQDCVNAIGEALHGKRNGKNGFDSCDCPVHGGHECLSVDVGDTGAITIYCHTCGKDGTPAIIEAIKQMGLPWPGPASPSFALSPEQVEARQREQAEKKAQKVRDQEAAAEEAIRLLKDASPDYQDHPYARKKGKVFEDDVRRGAFPGIPDALLIPFKSSPPGPVQTVQAIGPAGEKRFLAGGQKKGSAAYFSVFFWDTPCLCIAEGVATAGAVWQATGLPCIAAGDAGNMLEVARKTHKVYKRAEIILLADEDPPGIEAAEKAARLVGGKIARPQAALDTDAPDHYDFWDLWHERGADAVKLALDKAKDEKKKNPPLGGEGDLPGNPEANQKRLHITGFLQNSQLQVGEIQMKKETLNDTLAGIPQNATDQNAQLNLWEEQSAEAVKLEASPYPPGFYNEREGKAAGLWHVEWNKDGGEPPIRTRIGPCLDVLGKARMEGGTEWGLFLEWFDDDGTKHTWVMPETMLQGDSVEYRKRLASEGWRCALNQRARSKLKDFLEGMKPTRQVLLVSRTGWHKGAYVFPDETIQREGEGFCSPDHIHLNIDNPSNPFAQQGSLEAWREGVGRLAQGNSRLVLALSAAFAAILLDVCGLESGGFHFVGGSSEGKTTTLLAAASVWGPGKPASKQEDDSYVLSWRATDNGLEGAAALRSDAVLCIDEIGQAQPKVVCEAAYMLANGRGKSRARKDGTARQPLVWRCLVLSSGEESIADTIRATGGKVKAGQLIRLVDIPATADENKPDWGIVEDLHGYENSKGFIHAVEEAAATSYGTAARAFIRKVQEHGLTELAQFWRRYREAALEKLTGKETSGQVGRAGERFLLCAFAGEKATEWGILPWKKGEAMRGVQTCFRAWIAQRGGKGAAEDLAIVQQVRLFLEQHGNSRFQDFDSPDEKCQNRAGFRKQHGDTMRFYVLPEVFRTEVVKGYTSTRAGKVLFEAGMLEKPEDPIRYPQKVVLPGMGRTRCYILTFPDTPDTEKDN